MEQAVLSVRIGRADKKAFEAFCEKTGMNVSTAVNMYIKNVLMHQRLPFAVEADPFYSEENLKHLRASIAQMEATGGTVHELIGADDD